MAATQSHTSQPLKGLPSLLLPLPGSPGGSEASAGSSQMDVDIRSLLRALPTKADMEALMSRLEEQHRRDFHELRTEVHTLDDRVGKGEMEMSALELLVSQLEKSQAVFQDRLAEAQLQAEDLKNRSRWNNRIWGLPEATGPENLQETITAVFRQLVGMDAPASLEFDRVHCTLGPKPQDPDRPRDVICRLHRYTQKEQILRAAWNTDRIDFDGAELRIFPDVSRATLQRRAMLKPLLERLQWAVLQYRWGFPLQLTMRKERASFILRHHADLPDLFLFLNMEPFHIPDWLKQLPSRDFRQAPQALGTGLPRRSSRRRRGDLQPASARDHEA